VTGRKENTLQKLPRIGTALAVEPVTQSTLSTALIEANKEMLEVTMLPSHVYVDRGYKSICIAARLVGI
jgi:hypothetical protein